eukprot:CAMPEP_0169121004 /NCGR_PEP_ID=MMETSP1015-20121227/32420_1 /TAXON_ID=342587 /ORGANISM="Karlodinium micrum, Strain CCMP2283" /LENGTH=208 /DNA_ID=CAMNT_0009184045 /DNA_START=367 /DNA_END=993 /DNA_ORIENTATION=-
MAVVESPVMEMASNVSRWHCKKPLKCRRRILCPALPPSERGKSVERVKERCADPPPSQLPSYCVEQSRSESMPAPTPITVAVRLLYFSNDGSQADNGANHEIKTTTAASAEELLRMVRVAAGVNSGRLLFKMRPVNLAATLAEIGITADPKALHLMLSRKFRPQEVAAKAEIEAAKISEHIAAAAAAAPPKQPRQKRPMTPDSMDESL